LHLRLMPLHICSELHLLRFQRHMLAGE
jgi:hypothetical protein